MWRGLVSRLEIALHSARVGTYLCMFGIRDAGR